MKRSRSIFVSILTSLALASCDGLSFSFSLIPSNDNIPSSENISSSGHASSNHSSDHTSFPLPDGLCTLASEPVSAPYTPEAFATFFHPTTKVMFDFSLSRENLKRISDLGPSLATRDIYSQASVKISVTPKDEPTQTYCYPSVGLRMKGNTSRQSFVDEDGSIYNFVHFKVSFSASATDVPRIPNERFLGMARLDLKWNRNLDHTYIRELYGHKMQNAFLPLASEATLGGVSFHQLNPSRPELASTYLGLFTVIETTNTGLLNRHLGDGPQSEGNLYKLLYTNSGPADFSSQNTIVSSGGNHFRVNGGKIGVADYAAGYRPSYDLKTNSSSPNFSDLANLIGFLNGTTQYNNESFRSQLEQLVDIDGFLMMEALAYFLGNPDDFRNNFNNAYVYFSPITNRATFIPYDMDRGLGLNGNWDPTLHQDFSSSGPSMTNHGPFDRALLARWNNNFSNPLHRFTVMAGGMESMLTMYRQKLAQVANSPWVEVTPAGPGNYSGMFYTMHQQYRQTYYPVGGDFTYLRPTSPALRDLFVVFSINQRTLDNITFQDYMVAKLNTYQNAIN